MLFPITHNANVHNMDRNIFQLYHSYIHNNYSIFVEFVGFPVNIYYCIDIEKVCNAKEARSQCDRDSIEIIKACHTSPRTLTASNTELG